MREIGSYKEYQDGALEMIVRWDQNSKKMRSEEKNGEKPSCRAQLCHATANRRNAPSKKVRELNGAGSGGGF